MSDLTLLSKPFDPKDILWRVQSSGINPTGAWARVLAYVDARAVQERLDEVFGVLGWRDSYDMRAGGTVCSLSVKDGDDWITKQNGSPETDIEGFKGGMSKAFVRVASSGFGVGRYLYKLPAAFVNDTPNGKRKDKVKQKVQGAADKVVWMKWTEPKLPKWAMPEGAEQKEQYPAAATKAKNKQAAAQDNFKKSEIEGWKGLVDAAKVKKELAVWWPNFGADVKTDLGAEASIVYEYWVGLCNGLEAGGD